MIRSHGRRASRSTLWAPRRRLMPQAHYDPEAFGRFSEGVARLMGTARFLVFQSALVVVWIAVNVAFRGLRFDAYPFILLTLALSLQAAYAAPLILLAQTRQADRDRVTADRDRDTADRTHAEAEFLAREVAAVRIHAGRMGGELNDIGEAVRDVRASLARLEDLLGARPPEPPGGQPQADQPTLSR